MRSAGRAANLYEPAVGCGLGDVDERGAVSTRAEEARPGPEVVNDLEIEEMWPSRAGDMALEEPTPLHSLDSTTFGDELEPDFTNQQLSSDPIAASGASATASAP